MCSAPVQCAEDCAREDCTITGSDAIYLTFEECRLEGDEYIMRWSGNNRGYDIWVELNTTTVEWDYDLDDWILNAVEDICIDLPITPGCVCFSSDPCNTGNPDDPYNKIITQTCNLYQMDVCCEQNGQEHYTPVLIILTEGGEAGNANCA